MSGMIRRRKLLNKIVKKKTVRLTSVVLSVLILVSVLPFGADRTFRAEAESGDGVKPLEKYTVELVDAENNVLPVSGVGVTLTLNTDKQNDKNDESNEAEIPEEYKKPLSVNTDNSGAAVFENFVIPENRYTVNLETSTDSGCIIPEDWDNIGDSYAKTEFTAYVENVDGDNNFLLVPLDNTWLLPFDYTVKVKDSSGYTGQGAGIKLKYRLDGGEDLDGELYDQKGDISCFRIKGIYGKSYFVQAYGDRVKNEDSGVTNDPYSDPSTTVAIDAKGETDKEFDLEVLRREFDFTIKNFDFNLGTLYREDKNSEDGFTEISEEEKLNFKDTFKYGDSTKYKIKAYDGYRISSYSLFPNKAAQGINEKEVIADVKNINSGAEISVDFVKQNYTVEFLVGENGTVTLREDSEGLENLGGVVTVADKEALTVGETSDLLISAEANETYHLESLKYKKQGEDDGKFIDTLKDLKKQNEPKSHSFTIPNVHSGYVVKAEFSVDVFNLNAENSKDSKGNALGTVTFRKNNSEVKTIQIGDDITAEITPKKGYHVKSIIVEKEGSPESKSTLTLDSENLNESLDSQGNVTYSFDIENIRNNVKVSVNYEQDLTISQNNIFITKPDYTDNYYPNQKYDRYIYRYVTSGSRKTFNVTVSYTESETECRGIELVSDKGTSLAYTSFDDSEKHSAVNITQTQLVTSVRVYYEKQWHNVTLENGGILFLLDRDNPKDIENGALTRKDENGNVLSGDWTNTKSVTVSGRLNPADYSKESPLDCVIWSKDKTLDDDTLHQAQLLDYRRIDGFTLGKTDIKKTGDFTFNVSGQQDSTYYVYALDLSGNVYRYNGIKIGIDNTLPDVYRFNVHSTDSNGNTVTFDEFGATALSNITVTVLARDYNSGISSVRLIGYDNSSNEKAFDSEQTNDLKTDNFAPSFTITGACNMSLYATAKDNAGNEILIDQAAAMVQENSNSYSGNIVIKDITADSDTYNVTITADKNGENVKYQNGKDWYQSDDINVTYSAKESFIGFHSVVFNIIKYDKDGNVQSTEKIDSLSHEYNKEYDISKVNTYEKSHNTPTTVIDNTINLRQICEENNIILNPGKNTVEVIVSSRVKNGAEYYSKKSSYDFWLDTQLPTVNSIKFSESRKNAFQTVLNVLTFGLFANNNLQVDVEIDDGEEYASSGFKNVDLIYNGSVYSTAVPDSDGGTVQTVRFTIPKEDITSNGKHFDGKVTVQVYDNTENASGEYLPKSGDTDPSRSGEITAVMIENSAPVISEFKTENEYGDRNGNTFNGKTWYNKDITFGVEVSDGDSGVGKVEAEINGTAINGSDGSEYLYNSDKPNVLKLEPTFTEDKLVRTNASGVAMKEDGEYTLTVNVTDNAGNTANRSKTVYKDTSAPSVTQFEFLGEGYKNGDGAPNDNVEMTEYGYYFKEDTQIRIHTEDSYPSSGVNNIYFKAVPVVQSGSSAVEETAKVSADGTCVFTVPANFKGQIFAYADDNVGNSTNRYVTPSGTIIETPEEHNNESHISIRRLTEAPSSTGTGSPLYSGAVDVEFTVTDTYSGIQSAEVTINDKTYSVDIDNAQPDSDTIDSWHIDSRDYNLVTVLSRTITVSDNMNDIPITVRMTDRSGNTSTAESSFSIDTTAPTVKIEWDGTKPAPDNSKFYSRARTATITVTERNFSRRNFVADIKNTDNTIPSISGWSSSGSGDSATHTATITFSADGEYEFSAYCFDDVGNKSNTVTSEKFTMDFTKPVVNVSYDNNDSANGVYFNKDRTATIEITERNFDSSGVVVKGTASDNGKEIEFPKCSEWSSVGNKHTATVKYTKDALYTFSVSVKDKAGNTGSGGVQESFYIDKTAPSVVIEGVKDKSANNGTIAPVIKMTDKNYDQDGEEITLTASKKGEVSYASSSEPLPLGRVLTYNDFEHKKEVDDLYTLTVNITDLAGNNSTETFEFSANRFGSVYVVDPSLSEDGYLGRYNSETRDIKITEINVDAIGSVKMKVVTNGSPRDIKRSSDYTVEETSDGSWSKNIYTVKSDVFSEDGGYNVDVYSMDKARNENENIAEDKNADVEFGIDMHEPTITALNFESGEQINESTFTARVDIKDNIELDAESIAVSINGVEQEIEPDSEEEAMGIYKFNIKESNAKQTVEIIARDSAGNEHREEFSEVLVTTNAFVRWYSNTPLFVGSIIVVLALIAGAVIFIAAAARRKNKGGD